MVDRVPDGVFTMTFHPQTIGRGARVLLLERLIAHAAGRERDSCARPRPWPNGRPRNPHAAGGAA